MLTQSSLAYTPSREVAPPSHLCSSLVPRRTTHCPLPHPVLLPRPHAPTPTPSNYPPPHPSFSPSILPSFHPSVFINSHFLHLTSLILLTNSSDVLHQPRHPQLPTHTPSLLPAHHLLFLNTLLAGGPNGARGHLIHASVVEWLAVSRVDVDFDVAVVVALTIISVACTQFTDHLASA